MAGFEEASPSPTAVREVRERARPKSASFTKQSELIRMLLGWKWRVFYYCMALCGSDTTYTFKSLCMQFPEWMYMITLNSWKMKSHLIIIIIAHISSLRKYTSSLTKATPLTQPTRPRPHPSPIAMPLPYVLGT